mmetsp:Transcript_15507/g.65425  ORF Transcript_15507/g.65425 Transcript_15507/m.65425 type:complete len:271 (-) Transcript_15507:156-968(-)
MRRHGYHGVARVHDLCCRLDGVILRRQRAASERITEMATDCWKTGESSRGPYSPCRGKRTRHTSARLTPSQKACNIFSELNEHRGGTSLPRTSHTSFCHGLRLLREQRSVLWVVAECWLARRVDLSQQYSFGSRRNGLIRFRPGFGREGGEKAHADVPTDRRRLWVSCERVFDGGRTNRCCVGWPVRNRSVLQHDFSVYHRAFPHCREKCSLGNLLSCREARRHHRAANNSPSNSEPFASVHRVRWGFSGSVLCNDFFGRNQRSDHARYS